MWFPSFNPPGCLLNLATPTSEWVIWIIAPVKMAPAATGPLVRRGFLGRSCVSAVQQAIPAMIPTRMCGLAQHYRGRGPCRVVSFGDGVPCCFLDWRVGSTEPSAGGSGCRRAWIQVLGNPGRFQRRDGCCLPPHWGLPGCVSSRNGLAPGCGHVLIPEVMERTT